MNSDSVYEEIPFEDAMFPIRLLQNKRITPDTPEKEALTWHEQIEIHYFHSGSAAVTCGTRKYVTVPGEIYIINPYEIHDVAYYGGTLVFDCIMADPRIYHGAQDEVCEIKYMSQIENRKICFNNKISSSGEPAAIITELLKEYQQKQPAYELKVKSLILNFFAWLFRHEVNEKHTKDEILRTTQKFDKLRNAFSYIYDHYNEEINLSELAGSCNFNLSHFCRLFKSVTGQTAVQYINEVRMLKAELLLRTTNLGVAEIAGRVGYTDPCYFNRCFKRYFHATPLEMRSKPDL